MARPIFRNEVIGKVGESYEPQYNIAAENGNLTGAKISLINPITTAGTPQNADNMNNLFDMDNMDSMKGNVKATVFNADGSITEEIRAEGSDIVNARRETSYPMPATVVEKTTIYSDDGKTVLRQTTVTTTFGTSIKEEVS